MKLLLLVLLSFSLGAQSFTVSGNFPRDLYGPVDTRLPGVSCNVSPCIWGHADADMLPIAFKVPAGYRVHILGLRGDLIAWPKVLEGQEAVKPGSYAGVLLGFSTTLREGSTVCDWCADGVPLYVQGVVSDQPMRIPFDYDLRGQGVYLEADKLYLKLAEFLNSTGYPIHLEGTYTVVGRIEKAK